MKKTLFLLVLFFLLTIQINAQENTATKEETMEWIAGKFKDILVAPRKYHSYNDGVFTYYSPARNLVRIDFKNVSSFDDFYYDKNRSYQVFFRLKGRDLVKYGDGSTEDIFDDWTYDDDEGYVKVLDINNVSGLRLRLTKAFTHLVELNIGKRNDEKF